MSFPLSSLGRVQASWSRRPPASREKKEVLSRHLELGYPPLQMGRPKKYSPASNVVSPDYSRVRGDSTNGPRTTMDVCQRRPPQLPKPLKWALPLLLVHREALIHLIQAYPAEVTLTCRRTAVPAGGMLRTWLWYSKPCSCPDCLSPSLPRTQLLADVCESLPLLSTQYLGLCFFSQREQKPEPLPHPLLHIGF